MVLSLVILAVCIMQSDAAGSRKGRKRHGDMGHMGAMLESVLRAVRDEMEKKFDLKW